MKSFNNAHLFIPFLPDDEVVLARLRPPVKYKHND